MALAAKTIRHLYLAVGNSGLASSLVTKIDANGAGTDLTTLERKILARLSGARWLGNEIADKIDTPSALGTEANLACRRFLGSALEGSNLDAQIHPS